MVERWATRFSGETSNVQKPDICDVCGFVCTTETIRCGRQVGSEFVQHNVFCSLFCNTVHEVGEVQAKELFERAELSFERRERDSGRESSELSEEDNYANSVVITNA